MPIADPDLIRSPSRLSALQATGLLDSPPEKAFDRLTRLASRLVKAPVALVSLVDADRQFFMSESGLGEPWRSIRQTPLTHSFCQHVVATGRPLIVADGRLERLVSDNLAIPEIGVIAYAGMPLREPGGEVLGSFCAIDVEPRVWTADELSTLGDLAEAVMTEVALRGAVAELQRVGRAKDQMIGFVSHELRTPLGGMIGAMRVLEMDFPVDADREVLDAALRSGDRLLRLGNDLLSVEQIESHAMPLAFAPLDAADQVRRAIEAVAIVAGEAGITLLADATAARASADPDRLAQVLINLLGNAIKFAPRGSTVTVSATTEEPMVRFAVRDHGRGVPVEARERIFERFQQVESGDHHEKGGAGLGLAICVAIVRQHGGRIWVEDTPGGGSTFCFTLPAAGGVDRRRPR